METLKEEINIESADHPTRRRAIRIIERVIEPILSKRGYYEGLSGIEYYDTEDLLVDLLREKDSRECGCAYHTDRGECTDIPS